MAISFPPKTEPRAAASSSVSSPSSFNGGPQKRKREQTATSTVRAPAANAKFVREMMAQLHLCTKYLNEHRKEKTFEEIMNYLSLQNTPKEQQAAFRRFLQKDAEKIEFNPKKGTFRYRPAIPVENGDQLLIYLVRVQKDKDAFVGAKIEDIRDGWRDKDGGEKCTDTLDRMEKEGKLLISRDRSSKIKVVYVNDTSIFPQPIDMDLRNLWHSKPLPTTEEDLRKNLESWGLKAATAPKEAKSGYPKQKKPRAARRGGRQTNTHMLNILKDYSHKRA